MKLEDLVPPLGSCRQIPAGEFADSALVWCNIYSFEPNTKTHIGLWVRENFESTTDLPICPAPTLAEIMAAIGHATGRDPVCGYDHGVGEWWGLVDIRKRNPVTKEHDWLRIAFRDRNPATAAFGVWLELKEVSK